jgi:sugar phosphate isomerase/epimerase
VDAASKIDGMRVAVENVFDEEPEALAMLIERINNPHFGFCFDTGHFNLFSTVTMEAWFALLGKHLVEVHLHDNSGSADAHQALGKGTVDFARVFRLIRECPADPVFTLEAHDAEDIEPSLRTIRALMSDR